ncbi:hypothetical protein PR003_g20773 [Phytophthora rubi]|uniref:Uncharacterized protein n=1 Tax=Phytophthora rubi TaxID=129364 RepID=A0A6A4DK02_9STRA|nr:hypothetical protein PR001_g18790 [Phytophthora rubi]KAE9308329.1 hypothetical protein PR003_g20773 [Phytophthora rubi]
MGRSARVKRLREIYAEAEDEIAVHVVGLFSVPQRQGARRDVRQEDRRSAGLDGVHDALGDQRLVGSRVEEESVDFQSIHSRFDCA